MTACGDAVYPHLSWWQFWLQLQRKGLAPCLKWLNHGKACPASHFWSVIKTNPYIIRQNPSQTLEVHVERVTVRFIWEKRHISCHLEVFGCVKTERGCFWNSQNCKELSLALSMCELQGVGPSLALWPSTESVPQETPGFMGKSLLHFSSRGLEAATVHQFDPLQALDLDQSGLRDTCWSLLEQRNTLYVENVGVLKHFFYKMKLFLTWYTILNMQHQLQGTQEMVWAAHIGQDACLNVSGFSSVFWRAWIWIYFSWRVLACNFQTVSLLIQPRSTFSFCHIYTQNVMICSCIPSLIHSMTLQGPFFVF